MKVFITHCGLLGLQEAMYHATPVIGMPIAFDQTKNAAQMRNNGLGQIVNWNELTVEKLRGTIEEVLVNQRWDFQTYLVTKYPLQHLHGIRS